MTVDRGLERRDAPVPEGWEYNEDVSSEVVVEDDGNIIDGAICDENIVGGIPESRSDDK